MQTLTIKSPKTNRNIEVRVWDIDTQETVTFLKGRSARDLSLKLLSDKSSLKEMERTESSDCAGNNFSLAVFEHALDWSLGLAVYNFIVAALRVKRCPRRFKVAAARNGDVFILHPSGKVYLG